MKSLLIVGALILFTSSVYGHKSKSTFDYESGWAKYQMSKARKNSGNHRATIPLTINGVDQNVEWSKVLKNQKGKNLHFSNCIPLEIKMNTNFKYIHPYTGAILGIKDPYSEHIFGYIDTNTGTVLPVVCQKENEKFVGTSIDGKIVEQSDAVEACNNLAPKGYWKLPEKKHFDALKSDRDKIPQFLNEMIDPYADMRDQIFWSSSVDLESSAVHSFFQGSSWLNTRETLASIRCIGR